MKRIMLFIVICFVVIQAITQDTISYQTFYIIEGGDDVTQVVDEGPVLDQAYLKLGQTVDYENIWIGLRYQNITIHPGAEILSAYIQFTSYADGDGNSVMMSIKGEKIAQSTPFSTSINNLYWRSMTDESVPWYTQDWQSFIPGPDQKTPDIKDVIQEIIDQDDWAYGNALAILMFHFAASLDSLLACSYEYMGEFYAPMLKIEFYDPLGIAEQNEVLDVKIYPNPVIDQLNMEFDSKQSGDVIMKAFDRTGKQIGENVCKLKMQGENHFSWNTDNLTPGIYFVKLTNGNSTVSRKVIKF